MREIKFRGRDEFGEWHYGAFMGVFFDGVVALIEYANIYDDGMANRVLPDTVGQFTGLLDSEGHEIYEGDVVQSKELLFPYDTGVIRYCAELTRFYLDTGDGDINDLSDDEGLTVLGNVHDNPELLERGEN